MVLNSWPHSLVRQAAGTLAAGPAGVVSRLPAVRGWWAAPPQRNPRSVPAPGGTWVMWPRRGRRPGRMRPG